MIVHDNKETTAIYIGTRAIQIVYRGARLIWQAVRSCFGSGWWVNGNQWSNTDGWKNE